MSTDGVRIGIVGCGSVMRGPYTNQIRRMQARGMNVQVTRACDVVADREGTVRERFGEIPFSTDYRAVVEADDVDLVLVLTAMQAHGQIAKAALQAGKHCLVEKPMAPTLEEGAELLALAQRSEAILHPAPHVLLSPTYQTMWRRIHRGDIGQVLQARAFYGWNGPSWGQWFYRQGGGPLFDLGVYNVTSLTGLLGPARRVTAMTAQVRPERVVDGERIRIETEDSAHVLMEHAGGVLSVVSTGFTYQRYRVPAIEVYGSEGTIQMLGDDWDPDGYELWQNSVGAWQIYDETDPDWPWTDGLRHLVECIQAGTRPIITPEHGFHVLEIMLKAMEAGRTGRAQDIESTFTPPEFFAEGESRPAHLVHDRTSGRTD
ncbi:MAG TPA: Gfo/Idh/MocA family oxidoreductase [Roseiflexaceae bacterium]|nr:Gfo/Idh/MocA family oxidoreductase [Roseiflexaceae bacterium]